MFIIVAVYAEVFPIRSVLGIVMVIAVFVVHREQVSGLEVKLSGAFGANEPVNFE